jgi:hypothetical protein
MIIKYLFAGAYGLIVDSRFQLSGFYLSDTGKLRTFVSTGQESARLPARSALFEQRTGGLAAGWVTTS